MKIIHVDDNTRCISNTNEASKSAVTGSLGHCDIDHDIETDTCSNHGNTQDEIVSAVKPATNVLPSNVNAEICTEIKNPGNACDSEKDCRSHSLSKTSTNTTSPPKGKCGLCLNVVSKDSTQFAVNLDLSQKLTDVLNFNNLSKSVVAILPDLPVESTPLVVDNPSLNESPISTESIGGETVKVEIPQDNFIKVDEKPVTPKVESKKKLTKEQLKERVEKALKLVPHLTFTL